MSQKAEQQYIDLYGQCRQMICDHSVDVMNAVRDQAFEDFKRQGFPSRKVERYKYTDMQQLFAPDYGLNLNRLRIPVDPYEAFRCDVPNLSTSLYFMVNDQFHQETLPKVQLPEGVIIGSLAEVAAKRLSAIREFTSFGSGFRIAMRDLQIRGAGSLLGHSQHGHMEAVGYELYVKMLNQAIAAAKGEAPPPDKSDCLVDITVDAYLPEEYIPDAPGRIEAYKRIAAITNREDAGDVLDELIDRYGDPPRSVQGLVDISLVRVTAARAGVEEIVQKGENLILYSNVIGPRQLGALMDAMPHRVLYNAVARPYISLHVLRGEDPLTILRDAVALLPGA